MVLQGLNMVLRRVKLGFKKEKKVIDECGEKRREIKVIFLKLLKGNLSRFDRVF
jgi:hypothetical protein